MQLAIHHLEYLLAIWIIVMLHSQQNQFQSESVREDCEARALGLLRIRPSAGLRQVMPAIVFLFRPSALALHTDVVDLATLIGQRSAAR